MSFCVPRDETGLNRRSKHRQSRPCKQVTLIGVWLGPGAQARRVGVVGCSGVSMVPRREAC